MTEASTITESPSINTACAHHLHNISNHHDCDRFGCPHVPWNWASYWALEKLNLHPEDTVCDLGAGNNFILMKGFTESCKRAYLIDSLPFDSSRSLPDHVIAMQGDMCDLPLADESVDKVVSISVFEHIPTEYRLIAMKELQRVLKPGGRAALSICHFLNTNVSEAKPLLENLPFFTDRNCAVYLPLNTLEMLEAADQLTLIEPEDLSVFPDHPDYDEESLFNHPDLCSERFGDYEELASIKGLKETRSCEIGIVLEKQVS